MSILRTVKNKNYTCICNSVVRSGELSMAAAGLLSYLLSFPDDWKFTTTDISLRLKENVNTIKKYLGELSDKKYLIRNRNYSQESGRYEKSSWTVLESSSLVADFSESNTKTIIRANKIEQYTCIDNGFLHNKELSLEAKCLMTYLLTFSDNWSFNIKKIAQDFGIGEEKARRIRTELETAGYVEIQQGKGPNNTFAKNSWIVRESLKSVDIQQNEPQTKFPCTALPTEVIPTEENSQKLNNNKQNNKLLNIKSVRTNYLVKDLENNHISKINYEKTKENLANAIKTKCLYGTLPVYMKNDCATLDVVKAIEKIDFIIETMAIVIASETDWVKINTFEISKHLVLNAYNNLSTTDICKVIERLMLVQPTNERSYALQMIADTGRQAENKIATAN